MNELGERFSKQISDFDYRRDYVAQADIANFIKRHLSTLLLSVVLAVMLAAIYITQTTPIYTARAQLLIDSRNVQVREGSSESAYPLDSSQVESQIAILRSSMLASAVVEHLNLMDDPDFNRPAQPAIINGSAKPATPAEKISRDQKFRSLTEMIMDSLEIRRADLSYAINISYSARSPDFAARVANAMADGYLRDQANSRAAAAKAGSEWLEQRVGELRRQMNAAARRVQEFKASQDYRIVKSAERPPTKTPADPRLVEPEPTTLEELESTASTYRKIYENFYQAYTEAVQRESYPGSNARVISRAVTPTSRSHPKTLLIMALATLAGGMIGVAMSLIRDALSHPVRSAYQIPEHTGVPCLGEIPRIAGPDQGSLRMRAELMARHMWGGSVPNRRSNPLHEFVEAPQSPFSNAMRKVKTALRLARPGKEIRSIGVLSSLPNEGKSTVAFNLASVYALSGLKVLVVDSDLRGATLSRQIAPSAAVGLAEVLSRTAALEDAIVHMPELDMYLLPLRSGTEAQPALDQLTLENLTGLLEQIGTSFDMIIVDLPSAQAVAEAIPASAALDATIIVAESDVTPLVLLRELTSSLRAAKSQVLGTVITKTASTTSQGSARRSFSA